MQKNDFSPAAILVIEKYCHWINRGFEEEHKHYPDYNPEPLTIDDFFKYDSTSLDFDTEANDQRIIQITADYGDDGGASHLTAIFRRDLTAIFRRGYSEEEWELQTIIQEFDTAYRQIYLHDYITGKIGFTTAIPEVEEVEAQGLKIGLQKYTKEEQRLQTKRPIVR